MIFCGAIELKSSEPTLAQDRLVSRSSYKKCSNSVCFFSSRSRVESKNESISSGYEPRAFLAALYVIKSSIMILSKKTIL